MSSQYRINLRQAIYALSDALDYVGIDQLLHGKRVAYLSREIARSRGWDEPTMDRLTEGAILHDCGVSSTRVHEKLVAELDWDGSRRHCARGHRLLSDCPTLAHHANIVLHHHTHWRDLQAESSLDEQELLLSNLIYLADRIDALVAQGQSGGRSVLSARAGVMKVVAANRGKLFAPELVDAFERIATKEATWLMLGGDYVKEYLRRWVEAGEDSSIDFRTLRGIAGIFSNIVDAKSPYTAEHSQGVGLLARHIGQLCDLDRRHLEMLEIAGMLHDLGKLRVPDEILDKPGPLDAEEYLLIKHHSFDTFAILGRIKGFEDIARWAADHHETMNGNGYPFGYTDAQLPLESRILAAADIFQALAQNRPYRPPMPPNEILHSLSQMAKGGFLDADVVSCIGENLNDCWHAAMEHSL